MENFDDIVIHSDRRCPVCDKNLRVEYLFENGETLTVFSCKKHGVESILKPFDDAG